MIQAIRYLSSFIVYIVWTCTGRSARRCSGCGSGPAAPDQSARAWGVGMLRGTGITVRVEDSEHLDPDTPCVYMSNHASMIGHLGHSGGDPRNDSFRLQEEIGLDPADGGRTQGGKASPDRPA